MGGGQNGKSFNSWVTRAMRWTATQRAQARSNISAILKGQIFGVVLSTAGASATFGVSAGEAADSTGVDLMVLVSAFTKTTSAWAVGTGNGALDTSTIAVSSWYSVFLIKRPDTGVVDVLISLSATAPTLPAGYTLFRRIGSMKTTAASQWAAFVQEGDEFLWSVSVGDVNVTTLSTTATLFTLSVPTGVKVIAQFSIMTDRVVANGTQSVYITSPDQSDEASTSPGTAGAITMGIFNQGSTEIVMATEIRRRTDTLARIRARAVGALGQFAVQTYGWMDPRGRFA